MNIVLSIGILLLIIIFVIYNKHFWLLTLAIISLLNDLFYINLFIGPQLPVWSFISLMATPSILNFYLNSPYKLFNNSFKYIFYEYLFLIFLGVLFGFLFPWESNMDTGRLWNQRAEGRAFVSLIRLFSELMLVLYFYFLIAAKIISLERILKLVCIISSIVIIVGIIDYLTENALKSLLFNTTIVEGRFTGFNGEPRGLGRRCSFILLLLVALQFSNHSKPQFLKFYISLAGLGLILSLSASAMSASCVWLTLILLLNTKKVIPGISYVVIGATIFLFIRDLEFFKTETMKKIEIISGGDLEDKMPDEPDFFTRFEVFDRSAMNFLYFNPEYLLWGAGPNLISIPASNYISPYARKIYEDKIDSVPHMGSINILARSGLFGLLLFIIFSFKLHKIITRIFTDGFARNLFLCSLVFFILIMDQIFFAYIGIIGGMIKLKEEELKNIN